MAGLAHGSELDRLARELHALTEVAKTLTAPLELPELLRAVLATMASVLDLVDTAVVMLWDTSAGLFRPIASYGYDVDVLSRLGLRAGESITGKVYDEGQVHLYATPAEAAEAWGRGTGGRRRRNCGCAGRSWRRSYGCSTRR